MKRFPLVLASSIAVAVAFLPSVAGAVGITVDTGTTYQTMRGWEVTLNGFSFLTPDPRTDLYNPQLDPFRVVLIEDMANKVGINRVRLEIRSGAENPGDYFTEFLNGATNQSIRNHRYEKINDNSDPMVADPAGFQWSEIDYTVVNGVLPLKQLIEANGERLYISLCYVDFNFEPDQGSLRHGGNPDEYAELIHETFKHLDNTHGIVPDSFELVLEPENTDDWSSDRIGPAMVAAMTRLRADGYDPVVVAPSVRSAANTVPYANDIANTPGADGMLSMVSYHRYDVTDPAAIWTGASALGLETGMLEYTRGSVGALYDDLTIANVSAWQKWGVVAANVMYDDNLFFSDITSSTPNATITPRTAPMVPYFRYVRLGAQRVRVTSTSTGFLPAAFVNTNGSQVLVVRTGAGANTLEVTGLADGTYNITRVASNGAVTEETDVTVSGGMLDTTTIGDSVMAIYDTNTPGPNGGIGTGGTGGTGGTSGTGGTGGGSGSSGSNTGGMSATGGSNTGGSGATGGANASGGSGATGGTNSGDAGEAGADTGSGGSMPGGTGGSSTSGGTGGRGGTSGNTGGSGAMAANGGVPPTAAAASEDDGGCGCRLAGSRDRGRHPLGAGALALAMLLFARRRRVTR